MLRSILILPVCAAITWAQSGSYRFNTPQTEQSMKEVVTTLRTVAALPQVSYDLASATIHFSGTAEQMSFAEWALPQLDKEDGDGASLEFRFANGDIGRIRFLESLSKPQDVQELLTILRTVADVQKIFAVNLNRAMVFRGKDWEVAFDDWIVDQLDRPIPQKPDTTPLEFTIGGPDTIQGHAARINHLATLTTPRQMQETLTLLRTVAYVQKVFSLGSRHAFVMRWDDATMALAEWLITHLDEPADQGSGPLVYAAPAGDDIIRIFRVRNPTLQWMQSAAASLRSELNVTRFFWITEPANIVVRGTSDQIAAVSAWMTSHNALTD